MDSFYKPFFQELQRRNVSYVLCGGLAIVLHGYRRFTADIDVAIPLRTGQVRLFLDAMEALGYKPRAPVPAEVLADPEKRREWREEKGARAFTFCDHGHPYRQIDVFLDEVVPFEELHAASVIKRDGELEIRLASVGHLLRMKRNIVPPREHDKLDITILETLLKKEVGDANG